MHDVYHYIVTYVTETEPTILTDVILRAAARHASSRWHVLYIHTTCTSYNIMPVFMAVDKVFLAKKNK